MSDAEFPKISTKRQFLRLSDDEQRKYIEYMDEQHPLWDQELLASPWYACWWDRACDQLRFVKRVAWRAGQQLKTLMIRDWRRLYYQDANRDR